MDAVTASSTAATSAFGMDPQKFDLAALLKNVAAAAAASSAAAVAPVVTTATCAGQTTATLALPLTSSTATSPNSVESSTSTNGAQTASPSPPHSAASVADMKPISAASLAPPGVYQRRQLPFTPIKPSYAPSGHGRQILVYDSRSHPGRRREFAYKTRFTNQSGLTTVYYRCMACRALRHRLQRVFPKDKLPALQVPCIAVKNDLLINDPDFPDASDHFCSPLTIEESNQRLQNTFERGHKRARMKMASTAVEETIRKVGRLNAAAGGAMKAEEESEDGGAERDEEDEESTALRIDLWTKSTDATTTSSGLMELNGPGTHVQTGGEGSDCSSDSLVVDVMKEESPEDGEVTSAANDLLSHHQQHIAEHGSKGENGGVKHNSQARILLPSSLPRTTAATSKGVGITASGRSPRKKLDSLLKMAEMRAAATANGGAQPHIKDEGKVERARHGDAEEGTHNQPHEVVGPLLLGPHHQKRTDNVHASSSSNCSTSSSSSSTCRGHSGNALHNLQFNSLGSLLTNSASNQLPNALSAAVIGQNYQQPQLPHHQSPSSNNNNHFSSCANLQLANGVADSIQSIQAIASRLSRSGVAGSSSELSKALDGKTHQQQHHQKGMGGLLLNGNWEKPTLGVTTNPMMMMMGSAQQQQQHLTKGAMINGTGQHQQQQQLLVGELLRKYVENNPDLAVPADNAGTASGGGTQSRNAGELACAMFMAQMVENAELRQEVQKLRAELDSLKALVAAAAVVGTNNGFDNGGTNGHHHRHIH